MPKMRIEVLEKYRWAITVVVGCVFGALALAVLANSARAACPVGESCLPDEEFPPNTEIDSGPLPLSNSRVATFTFDSPNGIDPTFECSIDSTTAYSACSSGDSFNVNSDGQHTFRVRATDAGGTDSSPASYQWTVDTLGPVVNITSGPNGGSYQPGTTQSWSFTVSDATSGVQSVQCKVEATGASSAFGPCTGGASGHSVTSLPVGTYTFSVRATDRVGNQSVRARPFSIVPLITITDARLTEGNSGTKNAVFTARLSAASQQTITVDYATANGTAAAPGDYTAKSGGLTFLAGQTTKAIPVAVRGDIRDEANETFFVRLSGATRAIIFDASGRGTIVDND